MSKLLSAFGFFVGLGLLTFAYFNPTLVGAPEAREQSVANCRIVEAPIDEGYGLTRYETRQVCSR